MASTFVNDLRLNEMATGDQSGSWGTVTNTNLELIGEAFSYGTEAITTNANTHTTTIADGAADPGRSMYLKYTGALDSACTITIGPNTVSKMWFIENATSGSQNIIISQGSGANITIPAGKTKAVYSDGLGSGAAFFDAFAALAVGSITGDGSGLSKVVDQTSGTGSANIPVGTTAQRDGSPATGQLRFNSTDTGFEGYNGSQWGSIGGGAADGVFYENDQAVAANYTIVATKNAMTAGPITVNSGVSVTIETGARWVVL
jgi:hypothetical protein|tara:strand:- start:56 stop:835 length:780 start_codon:yes stop_codon:yes gene_type:complete